MNFYWFFYGFFCGVLGFLFGSYISFRSRRKQIHKEKMEVLK